MVTEGWNVCVERQGQMKSKNAQFLKLFYPLEGTKLHFFRSVISIIYLSMNKCYEINKIIHRLFEYGFTFDITKACRRVLAAYQDLLLRLTVWWKSPETMSDMIIHRCQKIDFGDPGVSMELKCAVDKNILSDYIHPLV